MNCCRIIRGQRDSGYGNSGKTAIKRMITFRDKAPYGGAEVYRAARAMSF